MRRTHRRRLAVLRAVRADLDDPTNPEARDKAIDRMPKTLLAVRQCLAMERRVRTDGLRDTEAAQRRDRQHAEDAEQARTAETSRKASRVFHAVAGLMEDDLADPDDADSDEFLAREADLRTRLSEERFDTEFAHLSVEEITRRVCEELSLPVPVFEPEGRISPPVRNAEPPPEPPEAPPSADPLPPDPAPQPYFRYSSA